MLGIEVRFLFPILRNDVPNFNVLSHKLPQRYSTHGAEINLIYRFYTHKIIGNALMSAMKLF